MKIVLVSLTCFILGGATFYGYNQYQKVNEENKSLKMKLQNTTPAAKSSDDNKTIAVTPTGELITTEEAKKGSIRGILGFPAGGIPELDVYAFDATDYKKYSMVSTKVNQVYFTIENIDPGNYYVVAYTKDAGLSGAYSKMVPCGLSVDCKDHSMIPVSVKSGEEVKDIEVKDWYAPEGSFPKKP